MLKYFITFFFLFCNLSFSQNISSEKELINKLTILSSDSIHNSDVYFKSNKSLEFSDSIETRLKLFKDDTIERHLIMFDICLLRCYSYFHLSKKYFQDNSYQYGIQLFEKGLDNLKKSLGVYDKCRSIISEFDKNKKKLKTLYDFCFNYYCEYKMQPAGEFDLVGKLENNFPELNNIRIFKWLNNYYLNLK
jgi:hypothetical protein